MKYLLLVFCFLSISGCYTRKKATSQFSRAAVAYPELPADYCTRTYPPKTNIIKGDTVTHFDTIYTGGETFFDTIKLKGDTIRITKTMQLPGAIVREKYFIHDTMQVVNTAEVDLWKIQANKAINIATDKTKEADKWRRLAKRRFLIILGMGAGIALGIFALIRRKVVKKII